MFACGRINLAARVRLSAWASATVVAAALLGCSVVDHYSGRAIIYNLEAEQAQEQALLLNIVRAYERRPMQFTTVSTITGTASVTGNAQYTFPTQAPYGAVTTVGGIAFSPVMPNGVVGGSLSGGPSFTVPVLDTKEFYSGILTAIPGQIWDLYIQANYPRDFLFNLFVEKVVMQRTDDRCQNLHTKQCEFVFFNHVAENIEIDLFQALGDQLLALGLTTELKDTPTVPFARPTNINLRFVGNPSGNKSDEAEVLGATGGPDSAGISPSTSYDLCFAPLTLKDTQLVSQSLCGEKPNKPDSKKLGGNQPRNNPPHSNQSAKQIKKSGSATVVLTASDEFINRLIGLAKEDGRPDVAERLKWFRHSQVNITVYMRHTEGMIYYLGELVRREFNDDDPRVIYVKHSKQPYKPHDTKITCYEPSVELPEVICAPIFRLHQGPAPEPGALVSVFYDGRYFSLPTPQPSQWDFSSMAFDFLKQQMALNSSAKSLPQSSVITAVGAP